MPTSPICTGLRFLQGNVPPAAPFLITQKWGKDVVKGGAFYKDAPPLTIPPSEARRDYLTQFLGDFVNRIAPPLKILKIMKNIYIMPVILPFY